MSKWIRYRFALALGSCSRSQAKADWRSLEICSSYWKTTAKLIQGIGHLYVCVCWVVHRSETKRYLIVIQFHLIEFAFTHYTFYISFLSIFSFCICILLFTFCSLTLFHRYSTGCSCCFSCTVIYYLIVVCSAAPKSIYKNTTHINTLDRYIVTLK